MILRKLWVKFSLKGGVSFRRCVISEVRSAAEIHYMWGLLPFFVDVVYLTALKGGGADPTANKVYLVVEGQWDVYA
jgi:hypothetical protein